MKGRIVIFFLCLSSFTRHVISTYAIEISNSTVRRNRQITTYSHIYLPNATITTSITPLAAFFSLTILIQFPLTPSQSQTQPSQTQRPPDHHVQPHLLSKCDHYDLYHTICNIFFLNLSSLGISCSLILKYFSS